MSAQAPDCFSIDVEEWFHMNYDSMAEYGDTELERRAEASTIELLDLLDEARSKATLFFLGSVARQYPHLVREAHARGHEIASHGYGHELVYSLTQEAFREDVQRSLEAIEDAVSTSVYGYRAPSWSYRVEASPWFYETLADLGFRYSASVFPFSTYLYGDSTAPTDWFRVDAGGRQLVELPTSVWETLGRRWPFSGGFYLRALPLFALRMAARGVRRTGKGVVWYLHPREVDPSHPRLPLPWRDRLVSYIGMKGCKRKVAKILAKSPSVTIHEYLERRGALPRSADARSEVREA